MTTYKVMRKFMNGRKDYTVKVGLTLEEAQAHCNDPETSWKTAISSDAQKLTAKYGPWFDCYYEEK